MKLIHTSPVKISKLDGNGRFGSFLFFSPVEYAMTARQYFAYEIEIKDDELIDASHLFYDENASRLQNLVSEIADRYDVSESTAEALLEESESIYDIDSSVDPDDLGEASWDIQQLTAEAAKLLGYRGVAVKDERGISYMIDMENRESELREIS